RCRDSECGLRRAGPRGDHAAADTRTRDGAGAPVKPAAFEYDDPTTLDEALDLLARHGDECKVLAGGQSLVPLMNFRLARPARLIDINGVTELAGITRENGGLKVGAMTRHVEVEYSDHVAAGWPLLREAIGWIGHSQIRNRGTVGGSV